MPPASPPHLQKVLLSLTHSSNNEDFPDWFGELVWLEELWLETAWPTKEGFGKAIGNMTVLPLLLILIGVEGILDEGWLSWQAFR